MTDMTTPDARTKSPRKPLRLWPGIAAAVLLVLVRLGLPALVPEGGMLGVLGALAAALVIIVWWVFFSRAPWLERLGIVVLMGAALAVTSLAVHESIRGGLMGMMLGLHGIPVLTFALVVGAWAGRRLSVGAARVAMIAAILIACALITVVRTGGVTGDGMSQLQWRWTPTPEQRLLAEEGPLPQPVPPIDAGTKPPAATPVQTPAAAAAAPAAAGPSAPAAPAPRETTAASASATADADPVVSRAAWPGFRGVARDGVVRGVRLDTDWVRSPPVEIWRRPIGPGWSSFAVRGDLLYTQEQRGDDEIVSCYRLSSGEPVWVHRDPVRFYESNGGAGPRGTPTIHAGRIYSMGATGIVNALDAGSGALAWSRNAATDTGTQIADWGVTSSPLVIDDLVIVAVGGQLAAYDTRTGDRRWLGAPGGGGYSSPHLVTIDGVKQVLLLRGARTIAVSPADGTTLWEHTTGQPSVSIVQPAVLPDGGLVIAAGDAMGGLGVRRLAVTKGPDGWTAEERWHSRGLKPYFNDLVTHAGHAFGFDASILSSIDLTDGTRNWKGGRYGHGQLVLLPDQDLLLVLSEEGELALVKATPDAFTEVARFKAIEGKTWNHPALIGNILLVRNGEEMAAFRMPTAAR